MYQEQNKWEQIKGAARLSWGKLTDDDFNRAEGSIERLYGIIHLRFGDTREHIKAKLDAPSLGNNKEASKTTHASSDNNSAAPQTKPAMPELGNTRDVNQAREGRLEVQLAQWGAALDELVVKVKQAGGVKADDRQHLEELKLKYHAAQLKFEELKAAGSEKWAGLADELELAWSELELAFKKLTN